MGDSILKILTEYIAVEDLPDGSVINFSRRNGCIPCIRLAPHYDAADKSLSDVEFYKVFLDEVELADLEQYMQEWNILSTPTVYRVVDGEKVLIEARTVVSLVEEING